MNVATGRVGEMTSILFGLAHTLGSVLAGPIFYKTKPALFNIVGGRSVGAFNEITAPRLLERFVYSGYGFAILPPVGIIDRIKVIHAKEVAPPAESPLANSLSN